MPNIYFNDKYNIFEFKTKKSLYLLAFQFYEQLKIYA